MLRYYELLICEDIVNYRLTARHSKKDVVAAYATKYVM